MAKTYLGTKLQDLGNLEVLDPTDKIVIVKPKDEGVMQLSEFFFYVQSNLDLSNYYTTTQAKNLFAEKADVYLKSDADARFAYLDRVYSKVQADTKYAFKDTTYTKEEADGKFAAADLTYPKSMLYTKDETYSTFALKTELPILPDLSPYSTTAKGDLRWAMKTDVFTKIESDARFAPIAKSYSKSETDGRYAMAVNTYTKEESDARFLNEEDGYTRTFIQNNIYFKPELYTRLESNNRFALKADVYTIASVNEQFAAKSWVFSRGEATETFAPIATTYTKTEVNTLVEGRVRPVADDLAANYYTKTNADAKYATKALTYTRTVSDGKYALINNTMTLTQLANTYYNKSQVDGIIDAIDWTPYLTKSVAASTYATLALTLSKAHIESNYYNNKTIDDKLTATITDLKADAASKYTTPAFTDGKYAPIVSVYTKTESDAKYSTLALTWSRTASDNRYYLKEAVDTAIADSKTTTLSDVAAIYLPSTLAASTYITADLANTTFATKALTYTKTETDAKYPLKTASYTKAEGDKRYWRLGLGTQTITDALATGNGAVLNLTNTHATNKESGRVVWNDRTTEVGHVKVTTGASGNGVFTVDVKPNTAGTPTTALTVNSDYIEHLVYGRLDTYFAKASETYTKVQSDALLSTIRNTYLTDANARSTYATIVNHDKLEGTVTALSNTVTTNRSYLDTNFATKALTYSKIEADARYYNSADPVLTVKGSGTTVGMILRAGGSGYRTGNLSLNYNDSTVGSIFGYMNGTDKALSTLSMSLLDSTGTKQITTMTLSSNGLWHKAYGDLHTYFANASETYKKSEVDGLIATSDARVHSKVEADARFGLKTDLTALTGRVTATEGVANAVTTNLANNYHTKSQVYTKVEGDARYYNNLTNDITITQSSGLTSPLTLKFANTGTSNDLGGNVWTRGGETYNLKTLLPTANKGRLSYSSSTGGVTNAILEVDEDTIWHNAYGNLHEKFAIAEETYTKTYIDTLFLGAEETAYTRVVLDSKFNELDGRKYNKVDTYSRVESDAKFELKAVAYSKAQSDAKYLVEGKPIVDFSGPVVGLNLISTAGTDTGYVHFFNKTAKYNSIGADLTGFHVMNTTGGKQLTVTDTGLHHLAYGDLHTYFAKTSDTYKKSEVYVKADVYTKDDVFNKTEADARYEYVGIAYTKAQSDGKYELKAVAYSKAQSDAKYPLKTASFTKSESDGRYAYKADSYTTTESDDKFALKTDSYVKDLVYTKTEADALYLASDNRNYSKTESDDKYGLKTDLTALTGRVTATEDVANSVKTDVATNFYTKTVSDGKYPLKTGVYTKTESDGKYGLKTDLVTVTNRVTATEGVADKAKTDLVALTTRVTTTEGVANTAKTDISALTTRVGATETVANNVKADLADNYYTKTQVYSQTQSNARYAYKTDSYLKSEVYTKTESDGKYPLKTNVYTKTESDGRYYNSSSQVLNIEGNNTNAGLIGLVLNDSSTSVDTPSIRFNSKNVTQGYMYYGSGNTLHINNGIIGSASLSTKISMAGIWHKVYGDLHTYFAKVSEYYSRVESDARYPLKTDSYTKAQSDAKYYSKTDSDARYYTKAQSDGNYYTKTDTDGKFALKTDSYTKEQSDTNYYSKTDTDDKFALQANVYTQEQTYSITQADGKFALKSNTYLKTESDANYHNKSVTYTRTEADARYEYVGVAYTKAISDGKYALKTDVYTKTQSDANYYTKTLSDGRYPLKTDVYTQAQTYSTSQADAKFALKTSVYTQEQTYSTSQADTKFALKTDSYTRSEVYKKTEADSRYLVVSPVGTTLNLTMTGVENGYNTDGLILDNTNALTNTDEKGNLTGGLNFKAAGKTRGTISMVDDVYYLMGLDETGSSVTPLLMVGTFGITTHAYGDLGSYFAKASEYYSKVEADGRYPLKTDSYTKAEGDARYHQKGVTYTRTEMDARYPLKSASYTKSESDGRYPLKTASYTKTESDGRYYNSSDQLLTVKSTNANAVGTGIVLDNTNTTGKSGNVSFNNKGVNVGFIYVTRAGATESVMSFHNASATGASVESLKLTNAGIWHNTYGDLHTYFAKSAEYYSKVEADARYPLKAASYTKSEADARYYDMAQANERFALKAASYTKAESDGKYPLKTASYTKAESDAKYYDTTQADTKFELKGTAYSKTQSNSTFLSKADFNAAMNVPDTRNTNETPQWYSTNAGKGVTREFKSATAVGVSTTGYVGLNTYMYYGGFSGGYPMQVAHAAGNRIFTRMGNNSTAWSAWLESETVEGAASKYYAKAQTYSTTQADAKFALKTDSYTKSVSDGRYHQKGVTYTRTEMDNRYPLKTASYTKAESDAKFYDTTQADAKFALKTASYTKAQGDARYVYRSDLGGEPTKLQRFLTKEYQPYVQLTNHPHIIKTVGEDIKFDAYSVLAIGDRYKKYDFIMEIKNTIQVVLSEGSPPQYFSGTTRVHVRYSPGYSYGGQLYSHTSSMEVVGYDSDWLGGTQGFLALGRPNIVSSNNEKALYIVYMPTQEYMDYLIPELGGENVFCRIDSVTIYEDKSEGTLIPAKPNGAVSITMSMMGNNPTPASIAQGTSLTEFALFNDLESALGLNNNHDKPGSQVNLSVPLTSDLTALDLLSPGKEKHVNEILSSYTYAKTELVERFMRHGTAYSKTEVYSKTESDNRFAPSTMNTYFGPNGTAKMTTKLKTLTVIRGSLQKAQWTDAGNGSLILETPLPTELSSSSMQVSIVSLAAVVIHTLLDGKIRILPLATTGFTTGNVEVRDKKIIATVSDPDVKASLDASKNVNVNFTIQWHV